MRTYASSRVKRKSFYWKKWSPDVFVDFRRPYLCTKTVHKYGVSIQSSKMVREMSRQITQKLWTTWTWDLDKLFTYQSFATFHFLGFFHRTVNNLLFCAVFLAWQWKWLEPGRAFPTLSPVLENFCRFPRPDRPLLGLRGWPMGVSWCSGKFCWWFCLVPRFSQQRWYLPQCNCSNLHNMQDGRCN